MSFVAASWPWRETCVRRGYLYVDARLFIDSVGVSRSSRPLATFHFHVSPQNLLT